MWIDFAGQFQKSLTALPLKTYQAGERVLANGSRTNELLILRNGTTKKPPINSASWGGCLWIF
jgi:hypothetical protein